MVNTKKKDKKGRESKVVQSGGYLRIKMRIKHIFLFMEVYEKEGSYCAVEQGKCS